MGFNFDISKLPMLTVHIIAHNWSYFRTYSWYYGTMYMYMYTTKITYLKKLSEHSVATALASSVLPVPGAPYSNIPMCVVNHVTYSHTHYIPDRLSPPANSSGWSSGSWMVSSISFLAFSKPPTSFHLTLGIYGIRNMLELYLHVHVQSKPIT